MDLIVDFILILGVFLNALVLLGLLQIKNKQLPHKILILFWGFVLLSFLHFYARLHRLDFLFVFSFFFVNGVRLFLAPLIYIYIQSIFSFKKFSLKKSSIHFIPFLIYQVVYVIPEIITDITEKNIFSYLSYINQYFNQGLWQDLYALLYLYLSLRLYYKSKRKLEHQYSNINNKDFTWIRNFLSIFLIVMILDLILVLLSVFFEFNASELGYITIIGLVISMLYLGYYGLTKSSIFLPDFLVAKNRMVSTLDQKDLNALKSKLEHLLLIEKIYLLPDLTLRTLAERMEISERKLSGLINDNMHTTFYDLINKYRVDEAKIRLKSLEFEKYSISGIGHSCGFNSRSSFYRIFKKETGITPTLFKKID